MYIYIYIYIHGNLPLHKFRPNYTINFWRQSWEYNYFICNGGNNRRNICLNLIICVLRVKLLFCFPTTWQLRISSAVKIIFSVLTHNYFLRYTESKVKPIRPKFHCVYGYFRLYWERHWTVRKKIRIVNDGGQRISEIWSFRVVTCLNIYGRSSEDLRCSELLYNKFSMDFSFCHHMGENHSFVASPITNQATGATTGLSLHGNNVSYRVLMEW
jgi:hypothetical protein